MSKIMIIQKIAVPLMSVLLLSGCAFKYNGMDQAQSAADRFPITVAEDTTTMDLVIQPGQTRLSASDKSRLGSLVSEYRQRGHGFVNVSMPSGSPNGGSAVSLGASIGQTLREAGLSVAAIKQTSYPASPGDQNAPIVISFTRYIASVSECGYWNESMTSNTRNTPPVNFGCATQNNLAALVQDPHDLIAPRGMTAADPARRSTVLDKYRKGSPTATSRTESEKGTVSEVK